MGSGRLVFVKAVGGKTAHLIALPEQPYCSHDFYTFLVQGQRPFQVSAFIGLEPVTDDELSDVNRRYLETGEVPVVTPAAPTASSTPVSVARRSRVGAGLGSSVPSVPIKRGGDRRAEAVGEIWSIEKWKRFDKQLEIVFKAVKELGQPSLDEVIEKLKDVEPFVGRASGIKAIRWFLGELVKTGYVRWI
jgi:hypothetical protein